MIAHGEERAATEDQNPLPGDWVRSQDRMAPAVRGGGSSVLTVGHYFLSKLHEAAGRTEAQGDTAPPRSALGLRDVCGRLQIFFNCLFWPPFVF